MIPETERKSADVLVLGGGMTGCMGGCCCSYGWPQRYSRG